MPDSIDGFETLFLYATEGIIVTSKAGEIIKSNPAVERMFGYDSGELIGNKIEMLVPERFQRQHIAHRKAFGSKPNFRKMGMGMDLFGRRKDQSEFPVEVSLSPFSNKDGFFVIAFIIDITIRKAAQDIIKKQKENLELLAVEHARILIELKNDKKILQQYLDVAGVMFLALDKSGTVKLINKKGCEILGYEEEGIVGKNWFSGFLPKSINKEVSAVFKSILKDDASYPEKFENVILRSDGNERIISWVNTVIRDVKGKPSGTLSSGEDITEQRALERKMLDAVMQGQEQERERLAKELHDGLGVLLSSVKANLGALEPGIAKVGKERAVYYENSLSLLDDAIREIRTIISDLSPRILEDRGLVMAIKDLCEKLDRSQKLSVNFFSAVDARYGKPLEKALYRIAQELINNAVKYSKASIITVQLMLHGNMLKLSVEDNGVGFDTRYLFDHNGRGLRNIAGRAKHLDGLFHIESEIGNGTLASVEVPVAE